MRVSLIKTDGAWLEATIATPHGDLTVMDEFSIVKRIAPEVGSDFDVELSAYTDDDASWEGMFSGNPDLRKCLCPKSGWSYMAYGQIICIDPVTVDCGCIQVPDVLHSNDPRVIGEYISFPITRLGATLI